MLMLVEKSKSDCFRGGVTVGERCGVAPAVHKEVGDKGRKEGSRLRAYSDVLEGDLAEHEIRLTH